MGTYDDPDQWITFNGLTSLGGAEPSCAQGSPGAVGSHYATVTTRSTTFGIIPGLISVGNASTNKAGFAYTSRPATLTGQWQYGIQAGDSGMVVAYFTKWNTATQHADSIGGGAALITGSHTGWTPLNISISYFSGANPDTAYVVVASSIRTPMAGSFIKIDALAFGTSSGIAQAPEKAVVSLYPSPASSVVNVVADQPIQQVDVMDMTGRTVMEKGTNAPNITLDVADLKPGRYLVQLRLANGERPVRSMVRE